MIMIVGVVVVVNILIVNHKFFSIINTNINNKKK